MSVQENQVPENNVRSNRRWIIIGGLLLIIVAVGLGIWLAGRGWVSTDDAQIQGDLVPISSRVSGYVNSITVSDNEQVRGGQLLVKLDQKDLLARVRSAEANLSLQVAQANAASTQVALVSKTSVAGAEQAGAAAQASGSAAMAAASQVNSAQAQALSAQAAAQAAQDAVAAARSDINTASSQVDAAKAALASSQADVTSAEAQAKRAAADAARYELLFKRGATSRQQYESVEAANTSAQSALVSARQRVNSSRAAVSQAQSRLVAAKAGLNQTISRAKAAQDAASQAQAGVRSAQEAFRAAQSQAAAARAGASGAQTAPQQISISQAQSKAANARIKAAMADVRNARLQLAYTQIMAPVDGIVSQKSVQPGQFVQPGQALMSVVPLKNVWVVANFKETDITDMKVGQKAEVEVDTYPGRKFPGHIQSIGAATGSKFSLLPPENATGNYVKVVQRIPVKIVLDGKLPKGVVLRPGMNVTANVKVTGR